jgi:hypothetical protein
VVRCALVRIGFTNPNKCTPNHHMCVCVCVCIVFSHKLLYTRMLLGTEIVFLLRMRQLLGGASRSCFITVPCLLMTTDINFIFRINFYNKVKVKQSRYRPKVAQSYPGN